MESMLQEVKLIKMSKQTKKLHCQSYLYFIHSTFIVWNVTCFCQFTTQQQAQV